jgi:hypothetical protein
MALSELSYTKYAARRHPWGLTEYRVAMAPRKRGPYSSLNQGFRAVANICKLFLPHSRFEYSLEPFDRQYPEHPRHRR